MNSFVDDVKYEWNKANGALTRLIIVNVAIFVVMLLMYFFSKISGVYVIYEFMEKALVLPASFTDFLFRPWTLLTYGFVHSLSDIFHIIFNMLGLYWFGRIISEHIGGNRLIGLFVWGVLAGGVAFLAMTNLIPFYANMQDHVSSFNLRGASAGVFAVIVGAATLLPDARMHLLFIGGVKLKWIAAVYVFLSVIGVAGENAGGNVAHVAGAMMGFVVIRQYMNGNDWSRPITRFMNWVQNLFKKKPTLRTAYRNPNKGKQQQKQAHQQQAKPNTNVNQAVIDKILDKISESGYESLTKEEKQTLFRASGKS